MLIRPNEPRWVRLQPSELLVAAVVGGARHTRSLADKRKDAYGKKDDERGWHIHVEGACGEMAAAKATGRYWAAPIDTFDTGDDVLGFQVRTRSKHEWDLIIRKQDADEKIFVLVTGWAPEYAVRGWILSKDAKITDFTRGYGDRTPAFFVPQWALNPMETLPPTQEIIRRVSLFA